MKAIVSLFILSIYLLADINVVVSKDNKLKEVSVKQLSKLYLKKSDNINGKSVEPIDTKENYDSFYEKVIKKRPEQIHAYWMKQIFTGKKRPPKKISQKELEDKIVYDSSIIGYTSTKVEQIKKGKVVYEAE